MNRQELIDDLDYIDLTTEMGKIELEINRLEKELKEYERNKQ